ncbi:toxin biosynthesis cytochrome P450 monooxygenase [Aspergillus heteromorphus CBS 117.55]|uniref:Toxin biosynthesis cytochrome P450 monooxygenase n=1 Tax=Aspergillus heteromorphus CBS 117.55 TaxID=1448321 RepID=A0A317VDD3_9EURO|nr:toxin biosynthesis cytochrome P450 monooxygenase [Aspergillus heteromorphus CBS 117.55]PWY71018.1 toxin biosynthesis cytochrome P450 monooxygenase [Aspergillus heteromorphus CBS 117.55]
MSANQSLPHSPPTRGLIAWAIYVLHFHPLAKYPGPKSWLFTRIPFARGLRTGTLIHRMKALHDQYGPIVRYGVNDLSYADGQAWKDIYGFHGGAAKNFDRDPRFYQPAVNGAHSILSANNLKHPYIRRLLAPAFTEAAVRDQESVLQHYSSLLITKLQSHARKDGPPHPVNLTDFYQFTTFDVAGDLMFGETFGCLEREDFHPWLSVMRAFFRRLLIGASFVALVPAVRPWLRYLVPRRLQEATKQRFAFTVDRIDRRLAQGEQNDRPDFITHMLRASDRMGIQTARPEIDSTFDVLVSAASETSSTGLIAATGYLLRNPKALARLQTELRDAFQTSDAITLAGVSAMPFLTAVLKEAMRLTPPSPTLRPRVVPAGGAVICGQWVPEGVCVGIPHWSTYRNANNFSRPDDFLPERWLAPEDGGIVLERHEVKAFNPFSYGPRGCLGKPLGWAEMRLVLAKVLWYFDLSETGPGNRWELQQSFVGWDVKPLMVALREVS